mmetsp:Transcript_6600/g.22736  ORF Transcript_6600/g.22736 Transcript_6600/m.22736 type:complete len:588 (-) Transcript_6600:3150-4913(-)
MATSALAQSRAATTALRLPSSSLRLPRRAGATPRTHHQTRSVACVAANLSRGWSRARLMASSAQRKDDPMAPVRRAVKAQASTATEPDVVDGGGPPEGPKDSQGWTIFGVKPTPEVTAIMLVYFVQGIIGLSRLAINFYLKDDLGLTPSEVTYITSASSIPWLIKPLYGFLSDSVPIFGYRRRSYLFLCGIRTPPLPPRSRLPAPPSRIVDGYVLVACPWSKCGGGEADSWLVVGSVAWGTLATVVDTPTEALVATIVSSLAIAVSDVVVDSVVVERARGEPPSYSGSLQSLCWGTAAFGGILSAYFSGSLVEEYGAKTVFAVTALLPLLTIAAAPLVKETRMVRPKNSSTLEGLKGVGRDFKDQSVRLWGAVKQPGILLPTIFVFLWQATPNPSSAMFFFQTNKLGFNPEFLGKVALVSSVAQLAGVGVYNTFMKELPLRKMFLASATLGTALGLSQLVLVTGYNQQLGISNEWFVLGDSVVLTVLGQVSFMPVLVLAAKICPEGVEATLFAALMSILNAGGVSSGILGGLLTDYLGVTADNFDNLFWLVLICNLSSLAPLPFLRLLPKDSDSVVPEGGEAADKDS